MLKGGRNPVKRIGNLINKLLSDDNLGRAIDEVNKTHRWRKGHKPNPCTAWVEETKPDRVKELRALISSGFHPNAPRMVTRYDASARKERTISEPRQWPDQYVHHALIQVIQPVCMRGMDGLCCGSIRGRGAHYAMKFLKRWMKDDIKGTRWTLCCDIRHFYDSLKPSVVMDRMRERIKDGQVLDLIERIIADGIKIGAYTSQWFANTVLQPLDVLIRESGMCAHYVRYMDNLTIFGPNKRKLRKLKGLIEEWLNAHGLELKGDWQIFQTAREEMKEPLPPPRNGVMRPGRLPDAVGYRYGRGFTLPRKHNLLRIKRALARYRKKGNSIKRVRGLLSRLGQLTHCNNYSLYHLLYHGERVVKKLKAAARAYQREEDFTWSMYLAQREAERCLKQRAALTAI